MPAYMLSFVRVDDVEAHAKDYMPYAHPILVRHGGKPLAVTDHYAVPEGELPKGRLVLVEFPSTEAANGFYNDPEYQPYKKLRHQISSSDFAIFDGLPNS